MALEQIDHIDQPDIIHIISPVAESIALLSSYIEPSDHSFVHRELNNFSKELTAESSHFLHEWKNKGGFDPLYLLNFFLISQSFKEMHTFLSDIKKLSDEQYLYYLLGEDVMMEQVTNLLNNPELAYDLKDKIPWMFEGQPEFLITLFAEIGTIRLGFHQLLKETMNSLTLLDHLSVKKQMYEDTLATTRSIQLKPLALAEHLMGKVFRRKSDYKSYIFIPSYFITPHRIRIFDHETCVVIYSCALPKVNLLEDSMELEKGVKALSDRNRIMILRILQKRKEYGARLANALDLTTATISHHLEILKQVRLVHEEKVGNIKYYSLNEEHFRWLLGKLQSFIHNEENQSDRLP